MFAADAGASVMMMAAIAAAPSNLLTTLLSPYALNKTSIIAGFCKTIVRCWKENSE
jgi:hypothetical protein